ncbi:ricin-type beta-trefoil lectin domain protein [Micromonospora rifamycinica]|uniref:Ricin-type beta-trefoil lectin domain-containing protein n=1 Tax=Micromonospora rifamycinica TaxID=291594 RepID=A0A1C5HKA4_9ACTN|nr:ricin-type beta-trefoil lectin domain protein [Micromonospora rifamycinica]SCG46456.1 Ricin-type beta-trefoil lectin domain-containing protein [Micromonospora rifamycinica]
MPLTTTSHRQRLERLVGAVRRRLSPLSGAARRRLSRLPGPPIVARIVAGVLALALAGLAGFAATTGFGTATAETVEGRAVPADQVPLIAQAALSCPTLTAPRLAGQLMAASGFEADARTDRGGSGVAGLTDELWKRWLPWPDAPRLDVAANIVALAHHMCDLVGQVARGEIDGDTWELALAAHHSGMPAVQADRGVPDAASGYVRTVVGYAEWYSRQPDFDTAGRTPTPAPPAPTAGSAPRPIPDEYLTAILAAGRTCPAVTPAKIAGQLMAASAFNPHLLGANGAQGIAQFLPTVWSRYATAGQSPWDAATAIATLGRTMCALTTDLGGLTADPYPLALAAFQWGPGIQAGGGPDLGMVDENAGRVLAYAAFYAQDPRLGGRPSSRPPLPAGTRGPVLALPTAAGTAAGVGSPHPSAAGPTRPAPAAAPSTPAAARPSTTPPPAAATGYRIRGYGGTCVHAPAAVDGQQLVISGCSSSVRQKWTLGGETVRMGSLCMDLADASSADGTRIQLATCNGGWAQRFWINGSGDLVNSAIGKCVDIRDWSTASGTGLQLWTCTGEANQKWTKVKA